MGAYGEELVVWSNQIRLLSGTVNNKIIKRPLNTLITRNFLGLRVHFLTAKGCEMRPASAGLLGLIVRFFNRERMRIDANISWVDGSFFNRK